MSLRAVMGACFWCLLISVFGGFPAANAFGDTFSVSGSRILKNGAEFVIHGVSVDGPGFKHQRPTIADVDCIVKLWRFNLVRVACSVVRKPGARDINDLDEIVSAFTSRGVVVLIDPRDHPGSYYQNPVTPQGTPSLSDLTSWYSGVAARYRDNPAVWFEVMGSPGSREDRSGADPWRTTHVAVIDAIRSAGATSNIIVCEGRYRGSDTNGNGALPVNDSSSAILTYGPGLVRKYSNLIFSFHTDEAWNGGTLKLENYLDRTQEANLAVFVSEYGGAGWSDSTPATETMLTTCKSRHVGRCAWNWNPTDNQRLCAPDDRQAGWQIDATDGSKPTNLSWLGDKVWDDNHGFVPIHGPLLDRRNWIATAFSSSTEQGGIYNQPDSALSPFILQEDYWGSNKAQEPGQWFQVDMASKQTFSRMLIDTRGRFADYPRGYEIRVSNDGISWGKPIAEGKNDQSVLRLTFPVQTARYIRIVQTGKTWHHWIIANIEVYAPVGAVRQAEAPLTVKKMIPIEPRAWGATAGPHRWWDVEVPLHPLQGDNRYTANGQVQRPGHYYQVDMGEPQHFNCIMLNCGRNPNDYPRGYEVNVSSDGLDWGKPIAAGRGSPITLISFPSQAARFVRVTLTRFGRSYWAIAEFRVYNNPRSLP